jgi:hypothetical protein
MTLREFGDIGGVATLLAEDINGVETFSGI